MTAYRTASNRDVLGGETTTVRGSAHNKLTGGKTADLPIVWDSGYSKDIISEEIVRALGVNINKLNRPLNIMTASGDSLYILGLVIDTLKHRSQTGGEKFLIVLFSEETRQKEKFWYLYKI